MKKIILSIAFITSIFIGGFGCQENGSTIIHLATDELAHDGSFSTLQWSNNGYTDLPFSCYETITIERGSSESLLIYQIEVNDPLGQTALGGDYEGYCPQTEWSTTLTNDEVNTLLTLVTEADLYNSDYPEITLPEGESECVGASSYSFEVSWFADGNNTATNNVVTVPGEVQCDPDLIPDEIENLKRTLMCMVYSCAIM